MNQSFRISDKALRLTLIVGTILLSVTILILAVAVGAARQREEAATTTTPNTGTRPVITTTSPSTDAGTTPSPVPEKQPFKLTQPVQGYLMSVHDTEALAYSLTMQDYRIHTGIDIEAEAGAPVVAAAAGTISAAYEDALMGYTIEIDHGDGYVSIYRNLDDTTPDGIEVGASVRAGQLIAAVGSSALVEQAERPHLHFELTKDNTLIDPLAYLTYEERVEE
ncbi:MAG: M23 family metallopeptidase [Clostridia bacterium]|nr:M23 family metallopeptidase [Clostridia bacterium]